MCAWHCWLSSPSPVSSLRASEPRQPCIAKVLVKIRSFIDVGSFLCIRRQRSLANERLLDHRIFQLASRTSRPCIVSSAAPLSWTGLPTFSYSRYADRIVICTLLASSVNQHALYQPPSFTVPDDNGSPKSPPEEVEQRRRRERYNRHSAARRGADVCRQRLCDPSTSPTTKSSQFDPTPPESLAHTTHRRASPVCWPVQDQLRGAAPAE